MPDIVQSISVGQFDADQRLIPFRATPLTITASAPANPDVTVRSAILNQISHPQSFWNGVPAFVFWCLIDVKQLSSVRFGPLIESIDAGYYQNMPCRVDQRLFDGIVPGDFCDAGFDCLPDRRVLRGSPRAMRGSTCRVAVLTERACADRSNPMKTL